MKAGLGMELPKDISLSLGYEYNLVSSLDTGDKMSDGFTPSLSLGTMWALGETTLLMLDGMARYSMTIGSCPIQYQDNLRMMEIIYS